jgi:hypothetical protein
MLGISLRSEHSEHVAPSICYSSLKDYVKIVNVKIEINTNGNFYQTSKHKLDSFQ